MPKNRALIGLAAAVAIAGVAVFAAVLATRPSPPVRDDQGLGPPGVDGADAAPAREHSHDDASPPYVGQPFTAKLKRLDGSVLDLPGDLKGKVVVVDFWASWCLPCVVSMPEMKRLYDKYKPQGLEIVGISLDEDRSETEKFIRDQGLGWVHTFTGRGWRDPTARQYGVEGIPSVWLVGRDGRIVTRNARGRLDALVSAALTVQPADDR